VIIYLGIVEGIMAFTVSLNGNNYISNKRKTAFEKALIEGQEVKIGGNGQKPPTADSYPHVTATNTQPSPVVAPTPSANTQPVRDYSRLFETLELGLKQSYGHQSETLKVHQQYLHNQAEYAQIFSQLMQQQGTLFSNGNTAPEKSEITLTVLQSLARSIEQFHQHQTETLNVHNQFLNQQSAYSQAFVQLLRQQVNGSNGENGSKKDVEPVESIARFGAPAEVRTPDIFQQVPERPVASDYVTPPPAVQPDARSEIIAEPITPLVDEKSMDNDVLMQMLLSIVSDKTGYPVEMLAVDMDMEADLGIDSIKRVEIMGALQDQYPDLLDIDAESLAELRTLAQIVRTIEKSDEVVSKVSELHLDVPETSPAHVDAASLLPKVDLTLTEMKATLLDIVSEKTGYPTEMLELNMDMEADLGIDSIKRVEILGSLQDRYPNIPEIHADVLSDLRTLQQIIDYIDRQEQTEKKV
jgi:acyl carrier protein